MNLDELRSVQAKERRKDSLQHLRDSFYDDVAAYIADIRAARDRRAAQVDNPFGDDDVRRMSDEIETAEEVAEALYERRVGKVVKLASFAAADMSVETEGMTSQERDLFDDLVDRISENKTEVLDVLAGEAATTDDEPVPTTTTDDDGSVPTDPDSVTADVDAASPDAAAPIDAELDTAGPNEPRNQPNEPETDSADALSSAMGAVDGDDGTDRSGDGAPGTTPEAPAGSGEEPADHTTSDGNATEPTANPAAGSEPDPTPVDPEPAPPGAIGASDEHDEHGGSDGARTAGNHGETTADGGEVTEPPATETTPSSLAQDDPQTRDSPDDTDRATVRITRDVGPILGIDDREYDLASEDVVTLPAANAEPLVDRDAAERID